MALVRERRHQQALKLSFVRRTYIRPPAELRQQWPLPGSSVRPDSPENLSDLEKVAVLGHGNGGTVYKVRHRRNNSIFALKVVRTIADAATVRQQSPREAEILKLVDSPSVVRCHGVFDAEEDGSLCFVMEFMNGGSLHDLLRRRRTLPENVLSGVSRRVLEGLNYLHGMRIVHRDIKPSNLLINGRGEVKIADFGVSRLVAGTTGCHSYVGTCAYMSPERLNPDGSGGLYDGFSGDVWALGVVLLECYLGYFPLIPPGQRPDWSTLMCAICFAEPPDLPPDASPEFRDFVTRCLDKDWRSRASAEVLLGHPFVTTKRNNSSHCLIDFGLDR